MRTDSERWERHLPELPFGLLVLAILRRHASAPPDARDDHRGIDQRGQ